MPIPAGHEFWVTTDKQYAEACTAEYMYLDYVRFPKANWSHTDQ